MGVKEHKARAPRSVAVAVITVSDSRTPETDDSGRLLRAALGRAGHSVVHYRIVRDDVRQIRATVRGILRARPRPGAVVLNGGTGVSPRDVTPEAVGPLYDKPLPGFGELFRAASFRAVGTAAMASRASAGVVDGVVVVALPGSPDACRLALRLLLPELPHLVSIAAPRTRRASRRRSRQRRTADGAGSGRREDQE